ncbi:hypothetical protein BJY04DRAFT_72035 [Aspergillus karnatakaensis]|uniref:Zn(II)2Cys6 transcription factor n=1 Tax=Aspergillus karnatakaensis TaxID=1810916 RepID=UPI003CCD437A
MPPRRSHTKSRNGCDQCKKRRVKCDEQGPPCSNCTSRELDCSFSRTPVARSTPSLPATPNTAYGHDARPSPNEPFQHDGSALASGLSTITELRRLELMHKFSTETYQSLCNSSADFYIWQMTIPRLALNHGFLMKGILAVAALHLASSMDPAEAPIYINTALEYHNQTLAPYRHAIDEINPRNCDAVFAHSVVTTIISIALPRSTTEGHGSNGMTEKIILAAELLQGVSSISRLCRPWMNVQLFTTGVDFWAYSNTPLDADAEAALNDLSTLADDVTDVDQQGMLKESIKMLRNCFARYTKMRDVASPLAWLAVANKDFFHALRCRQPMVLLVLMHWGVLLHELNGKVWWAKDSGAALVLDLLAELQPYHSRWEAVLLWPKQRIGSRGQLTYLGGNGIRQSH